MRQHRARNTVPRPSQVHAVKGLFPENIAMRNNNTPNSLVRQTVDDLIIAELFLVQATIESATAIGDGLSALGRQITTANEIGTAPAATIGRTLQRIADNALEPYSSRFKYLMDRKNVEG